MAVSSKMKILQVKQLSTFFFFWEFDFPLHVLDWKSENALAIFYMALILFNLIIVYSC